MPSTLAGFPPYSRVPRITKALFLSLLGIVLFAAANSAAAITLLDMALALCMPAA